MFTEQEKRDLIEKFRKSVSAINEALHACGGGEMCPRCKSMKEEIYWLDIEVSGLKEWAKLKDREIYRLKSRLGED